MSGKFFSDEEYKIPRDELIIERLVKVFTLASSDSFSAPDCEPTPGIKTRKPTKASRRYILRGRTK